MRVSLTKKVAIGYLIATPVLISITLFEFRYIRGLQKDAEAIDHTHQVKEHLRYLLFLVRDMESAERGYLISNREEFLGPYESAREALPAEIQTINNLISGSDKGTERLRSLQELINRKVNLVSEAIRLQKEGRKSEAAALVQAGEGKELMDEIRLHAAEMEAAELELLTSRLENKRRRARVALIATTIVVGINLFAFAVLFALIRREIKQRGLAENTLRESEERFKQLVQHAGDIIYRTDQKGIFTFINATVEPLTGYTPEEWLGRHYLDLVSPSWRDRVQKFYRQQVMEQTPSSYHQFPVQRKDGSELWVGQNVQLIFHGKTVVGTQSVSRDISLRVQLDEELGHARDAALQSNRLKSEFLANMSHEIRTPMNGIIGMTNLLADTQLNEDQQHFVDGIRQSADALLAIINDILDFSRIEAGKIQIDPVDFELTLFIEGIISLFVEAAGSKNIELTSIIENDVPPVLNADSSLLRQILLNLLGNAIKFTEQGEVGLRVRRLNRTGSGVVCRFEVRDTGLGISEDAQARLFNAFVQADGSTTRRFGGSGLGLAISKGLVEAMGGEIGIESRSGVGSTFWFTLSAGTPDQAGIYVTPKRTDLEGLRALVLDDQPTNRESLTRQLLSWRVDVTESDDPEGAIDILRGGLSDGRPFDFAIIDHEIYGHNGLDIARAIHTEKDLAQVRLILASTFGQRPPQDAIITAGVTASLTKPVRQSQLYDCLVDVMKDQFPGASSLKAQSSPDSAMQMPVTLRDKQERPGYEHARLLVVEDNPINQEVARYQIEKTGYPVDVAKDGKEALEMLDQRDYGLILMDCHMPVMDGFEATARIRQRADHKRRIPIIAVTASGTKGEREKCLQAGMDDFLLKPFREEELSKKIEDWISHLSPLSNDGKNTPEETVQNTANEVAERLTQLEQDYGKEMVLKIVKIFGPDADVRLEAIDQAIKEKDYKGLEAAAHGLKGAAANVGATEMAQLCEVLETQGELGSLNDADRIMKELFLSWTKVRIQIETYR